MKTFRVRYLVAFILVAGLLSAAVSGTVASPQIDPTHYATVVNTLQTDVLTHRDAWANHEWQVSFSDQLSAGHVEAVLQDAAGKEVFRSISAPESVPLHQTVILDSGRLVGTLAFYIPQLDTNIWTTSIAPWLVLIDQIVLFLLLSWLAQRYLVKPLTAMSQAAHQIADGDLDFELPSTRVFEISQVAVAFEKMRDGLQESVKRETELEEERRFFITAIAHDLRTPLFSLRGYLEGLEQGIPTTPEKSAHYLAMCQDKANLIERLISDLFAYTRLEYLEQIPKRDPLDLGVLLSDAVAEIQPLADARQITLELASIQDTALMQGDRFMLLRVVQNLLENAVAYTPIAGNISIDCRAIAGTVSFSIADDGPGIAPKDLPHIFEPLYRGDPSHRSASGNSGLGLAIAKRIVQAHGGTIQVESLTPGTRFVVCLPYSTRNI